MGEVSLGNLYDLNKNAMSQIKPLSNSKITEKLKEIKTYFARKQDRFFMLLCHEQRDYTVFVLEKSQSRAEDSLNEAVQALKDCLNNRGLILSIDINEDDVIECWVRINEENFAYYLFPYNEGVIIC